MAILTTRFWKSHLFAAITIAALATGVIAAFGSLRQIVAATAPNSYEGPTPPSELTSLLRNDPMHSNVGEFVFLNDVRLKAGPAPSLFYAIGAADDRVLVQFESAKLRPGKDSLSVDIQGVIHKMPGASLAHREWQVSRSTWKKLAVQPIYVVAKEVTTNLRKTP
jgi:hypothetical protein